MGATATDLGQAVTADVIQGAIQHDIQVISGDGAITIKSGKVFLTKASAAAITLADPVAGLQSAGGDDGKVLEVISTTAQAHTVTIAGGLNGAGTGADVGTYGTTIGNRFQAVAYNGKWWAAGANVGVTFA